MAWVYHWTAAVPTNIAVTNDLYGAVQQMIAMVIYDADGQLSSQLLLPRWPLNWPGISGQGSVLVIIGHLMSSV